MSLWLDRSLVVTTEGPSGTSLTTVAQPFLRVGSDPESDILLPGLARRSVYVHATPEGIYGVVLSGASHAIYPPVHWFRPDDPLEIGHHKMWVAFESGDPRTPPEVSPITWG